MTGASTWHPAPGPGPGPALLWVKGEAEAVPPPAALHGTGVGLLVLEGPAAEATGDREAVRELDGALRELAAREEVDPERVAVGGDGRGGTLAFLLGCHSDGVAAVVDLFGPLEYPANDAARPVQPLELALNLSAPLLAVFDADAPGPEASERAARVLSQFARDFDIVTASRREWGPPADAGGAEDAWERLATFLQRAFEDE